MSSRHGPGSASTTARVSFNKACTCKSLNISPPHSEESMPRLRRQLADHAPLHLARPAPGTLARALVPVLLDQLGVEHLEVPLALGPEVVPGKIPTRIRRPFDLQRVAVMDVQAVIIPELRP